MSALFRSPRRASAARVVVSSVVLVTALLLPGHPPRAQTVLTGHYWPLYGSGLRSGIMTQRRGVVVQNATLFWHANDFRDDNGNSISGIDEVNIWANRVSLLWVPGLRLLGADYATALVLPFANLAPNPVVVSGATLNTGIGLGDMAVAPVMLGWHWTDVHVQAGYTFFAPTGRFRLGASDNVGKGFWTNMLNAGVTWMPARERPWHASMMTRYEIHTRQHGHDVVPGQTLTMEFGVGKRVLEAIDVGVIGYLYREVTRTAGRDALDPQGYSSGGAGVEVQFPILGRFPTKIRTGSDFLARNLGQGPWVVLEFNVPL